MRQATQDDARVISDILIEAARWLEQTGRPLWRIEDLSPPIIATQVDLFFLAEVNREAIGILKFQTEDNLFWPDLSYPDAAYIHRVAVRRSFAGLKISHRILAWAVAHARSLGKSYLRLDCEAARPGLRAVYENFGFDHHSDRQVGPYFVARYEYKL